MQARAERPLSPATTALPAYREPNTAPCGIARPPAPCGHSLRSKFSPARAAPASLKPSSRLSAPVAGSRCAINTHAPSSDVTTIRGAAGSAAIQCGPAKAESSVRRDASRGFAGSLRSNATIARSVAEGWIQ